MIVDTLRLYEVLSSGHFTWCNYASVGRHPQNETNPVLNAVASQKWHIIQPNIRSWSLENCLANWGLPRQMYRDGKKMPGSYIWCAECGISTLSHLYEWKISVKVPVSTLMM